MRISLLVIFSIFLVSSVVLVSSVQNSFADEVVATSIGFEDSTILELKNIRGGTEKIDSVRVWLSGENEFKSFKTEQGWTGMNTPQGVIIFSSQNEINPGEKVKFGIKTLKDNPVINWKAVNAEGQVISSASTKITISDDVDEKPGFNESKVVGINEESNFRFIPEKPSSNSDFRVIGEGFVPNESLDFYIGKELQKTIKVDKDGKILFTSKTPIVKDDERVEFVLTDSGGNEKSLSIRIPETENREISQIIKLSLGNTEKEAKRGEMVMLEGMATPNTTLTITSKHSNGDILNIDIVKVGFDGKWKHDNLFGPELELGTLSIEITDGKTTVLRNVDIISAKVINISTSETRYEKGDIIKFEGSAIANQDMSVILEDAIGAEIFSRVISVGETGKVDFEIEIPRGAVEGTYVLLSYQENEEGITIFGIGQEPESILVVRTPKLNFAAGETANIMIQGPSNAQVAIIVIDSADREKFSDTINLGPDGKGIYEIDTDDLANGSYTLNAKRGESSGSVVFTIGLTTGSGAISIQTTRDEYRPGDQILILGNTGSINVLLDITIRDSDGKTIKKIETFSDRFGVFKIDNFRIPNDAILGTWEVNAKSGGNFKSFFFEVKGEKQYITVDLDRNNYRANDLMTVSGDGARNSSTVTIKIYNSEGVQINELNITAKGNGDYSTIWQVPGDLEVGEYEIMVDDGSTNSSITFIIE